MGWRTATTFFPRSLRIRARNRVVWDFPAPVRTAVTAITGLVDSSIVRVAEQRPKLEPQPMTRLAWCMTYSCETSE